VQINKKLSLQSLTLWHFALASKVQNPFLRVLRTQREKINQLSSALSNKNKSKTRCGRKYKKPNGDMHRK